MNNTLLRIYLTFKSIPPVLGVIMLFLLLGVLFVVGPCLPFVTYQVNQETVTQAQFWRSGAGPATVGSGILMVTVAVATLCRKRWARPALIGLAPGILLVQTAFFGDWSNFWGPFAACWVISLPLAFYLYKSSVVRTFFGN